MKRNVSVLLVFILASAGGATAVASAHPGGSTARAARSDTVSLHHTRLGSILVSSSGHTLYEFTKDQKNKDVCATISGCTKTWPPLTTSGKPTAGSGVKSSLLSTISVSGGRKQVTYDGHPLYLYSGDKGPGETSYVGAKEFGGTWYAINASGGAVKQKKPGSSPAY